MMNFGMLTIKKMGVTCHLTNEVEGGAAGRREGKGKKRKLKGL
jgi:hypothetical protein